MTDTAPYQPPSHRPQRKLRWGCIALFFAVPIGVLFLGALSVRIAWTVRESLGRSAMEKRLAEMKAEGIPVDNDMIDAEYVSRTSSTNSERWINLLDTLDGPEFDQQTQGVYYFDSTLQDVAFEADGDWPYDAAMREFVIAHRREIDEIAELSSFREAVTFPIEFESWNTNLPYTQKMRTASRLMWLEGLMAIRDRDSKRIARAIKALLGNAEACSEEPFLISRLTGSAQVLMSVNLAKLAIENQRLELDELNALLPLFLESSKVDDSWQSAIRGERAISIPSFKHPNESMGSKSNKPIPARGRDCIIYLELMAKAEQIETPDIDSLRDAGKQMASELKSVLDNGSWLTRLDSIMTGIMIPSFEAYSEALVRKLMRCRLAAIAIKIEIIRRTEARFPTGLEELGLPLDELMPPGGKPFGYRVGSEGNATLWGYSLMIGPNEAPTTCTPDNPPPTEGLPHIVEDNASVTWRFKK